MLDLREVYEKCFSVSFANVQYQGKCLIYHRTLKILMPYGYAFSYLCSNCQRIHGSCWPHLMWTWQSWGCLCWQMWGVFLPNPQTVNLQTDCCRWCGLLHTRQPHQGSPQSRKWWTVTENGWPWEFIANFWAWWNPIIDCHYGKY